MTRLRAEYGWSTLLALGIVGAFVAVGLPSHRLHADVAASEQRQLVAAVVAAMGTAVVSGSPTHRVVGYADTHQNCAAEASLRIRTRLPPNQVAGRLAGRGLHELDVAVVGAQTLRIRVVQTLGLSRVDWSCWH